MDLGQQRYGDYAPGATLKWLLGMLNEPRGLMIRTKKAFLIGGIITAPWRPKHAEFHMLVICAEPGAHWQAMKLLRFSVGWARERGCLQWRACSDYSDIGALCRRLGAKEIPRYVLVL